MNKNWIIALSIIILLLIVAPIVGILVQDYFTYKDPLPDRSINLPDPPSVLWQKNLNNFISDIVTDGKRVYVVDGINAICLNRTTGKQIWKSDTIEAQHNVVPKTVNGAEVKGNSLIAITEPASWNVIRLGIVGK